MKVAVIPSQYGVCSSKSNSKDLIKTTTHLGRQRATALMQRNLNFEPAYWYCRNTNTNKYRSMWVEF